MSEKAKDPFTELVETFSKALRPVFEALNEYIVLIGLAPTVLKRLQEAVEKKRGLSLGPTDVKVLALLLKQLSDQKGK